jgi:hypothetical protein
MGQLGVPIPSGPVTFTGSANRSTFSGTPGAESLRRFPPSGSLLERVIRIEIPEIPTMNPGLSDRRRAFAPRSTNCRYNAR